MTPTRDLFPSRTFPVSILFNFSISNLAAHDKVSRRYYAPGTSNLPIVSPSIHLNIKYQQLYYLCSRSTKPATDKSSPPGAANILSEQRPTAYGRSTRAIYIGDRPINFSKGEVQLPLRPPPFEQQSVIKLVIELSVGSPKILLVHVNRVPSHE